MLHVICLRADSRVDDRKMKLMDNGNALSTNNAWYPTHLDLENPRLFTG